MSQRSLDCFSRPKAKSRFTLRSALYIYLMASYITYSKKCVTLRTFFSPSRKRINELDGRMCEKSVRVLDYIIKILIRGNSYQYQLRVILRSYCVCRDAGAREK